MNQANIIKQAKGTSRRQVELYTLTAQPDNSYLVRLDVHDNRMTQEFDAYNNTWDYPDYRQAETKFYELVGNFTFSQLSADGYATLKVIRDISHHDKTNSH